MLILRTCKSDMTSHNGFPWPRLGPVEAPDWDPTPKCGGGLQGFENGVGDWTLANWSDDANWLVAFVEDNSVVRLGGKVKFPRANVLFCGSRFDATNYLVENGCRGLPIMGVTLTGGDRATLTGGYRSTLTGGYRSTLTGGYRSTLTGGDQSTLTGGDGSTLTGGDRSTLTGGYWSTLTGGDGSTLTGGDGSTLTGGDGSTLTGGDGSTLTFSYWDGRKRLVTVYVGEDGILPNVPYRLNHKVISCSVKS